MPAGSRAGAMYHIMVRPCERVGSRCDAGVRIVERPVFDPQFPGEICRDNPCETASPEGFPADLVKAARRKLIQVDNAVILSDLAASPGNRLEPLKGELRGKHSIRVNDKWRIIFRWSEAGPEDVEITDYHRG